MLKTHKVLSRQRVKSYEKTLHKEKGDCYLGKGSNSETGIFPSSWKKATVIPLYKGGDRTDVGNYRPISLLPLPGKLLEKIAHQRITYFLESNNILNDKQNGFRKGFSTVSAVADLTDDIFRAINNDKLTLAVFVDFKKAFDTVCHEILCKKLEKYGVGGRVLKWCTDYLTNRSQKTLANNCKSSSEPLTCGVPQGSVLGPLFFILYVNDLQQQLPNVDVQLYADDTVLYTSGANTDNLMDCLQRSLNKLIRWCSVNKLSFNPTKTKIVQFGTRQALKKAKLNSKKSLTLLGKKIQNLSSFKYLGFTLDATLNFKSHIADVIRKGHA